MAGMFRNEFLDNDHALGEASYSNLRNQYDYYSNQFTCIIVLFLSGLVYKSLWIVYILRYGSQTPPHAIIKNAFSARPSARKIIRAGLRWREGIYSTAVPSNSHHGSEHASINGVFEIGDCCDGDEDAVTQVHFGNSFHSP